MEKGRRAQYLVTAAVSLAAIVAGATQAWSTPVIPKFHNNETNIAITDNEISWMAAIASPGYMSGSMATRFISDKFGRRTVVLGSALPILIGTTVLLTTASAPCLYVTRYLWGFGNGMYGTVSAMYLAEIADKEIRGKLTASIRFTLSFGSFIIMSVGPFMSFNAISYIFLVLPICYFVACSFIPETPYFYLKEGKVNAARASLKRLSGDRDEKVIEDRLSAMRLDVQKEMHRSGSAKEMFTGKRYRKALIIASGLKATQIMAGPIAIQQYFGRIVQESKTNVNISIVLITFGAVKFIVGIISSMIVDKVGRRPLLIYSYLGSGIALGVVGAYFLIQPTSSPYYTYIPFIGIILSSVVSILGYEPMVFVVSSEIFALNVKSVAMTYLNILGGLLNFLCVKGYQPMKDVAGLTGVFWFYATFAFIGGAFSFLMVPETNGKSLREIQIQMQGDLYDESYDKPHNVVVDDEAEGTELKKLKQDDT
ncbi:facilitated trehalose transporter Tret1-like isoform X2 [Spodoptera frugiperda]|uniref:Facilitated trehalose transporter Tret1-like isoform X2 n=1 Tax=Spodoptera frugiperda TaxID=7108 RepID=A0A9R0F4Y6_SPOFR|nr:facilitated trehalose transporter Tret1-like isoform X2 [Spodoptera frugiperda]XP_050560718.1 facilitated trehalose transporter Tret1-like isoform X2 [Spodoptera frugiperda]